VIDCGKDKLSYSCSKYYNPTEHLAVGEIVVLFRGRLIFKEHLQKKTQMVENKNVQHV